MWLAAIGPLGDAIAVTPGTAWRRTDGLILADFTLDGSTGTIALVVALTADGEVAGLLLQ